MRRCNTGRGRCTADGHAHDYHRHLRAKAGAPGPPTDQPARGPPPSRDVQGAGQRQPPTAAARPGPRRGAVRHRPRRPGGYARPGGLQPARPPGRPAHPGGPPRRQPHLLSHRGPLRHPAAGAGLVPGRGRRHRDPGEGGAVSQPTTSPPRATHPARQPAHSRFRVAEGCLDCAGDLEGALSHLAGVQAVEVLSAARIVTISHDGRLDPAAVSELAGLAVDRLAHQHTLGTTLYLATVAVGGVFPFRTAIDVLRRRRLTIGALLVIATAGALALGVVSEAAMLVVVFSLGGVLEDYVSDRARGAIRALMTLAPPTAHRQSSDGCLEEAPVEQLQPGEAVLVRPGERLPTDGVVLAGASAVDQSPVTGESLPVEVTAGTEVFGGTVNGTGALTMRVAKPYQDTTLARIIRQVEQAQAHRGRAQRFADRFGDTYTPLMVVLAVLVALVPPLLAGDWRGWLYRGLVVLVVSCSCALVISVPVAVVAAVSRAARDGILIKGGAHLETLGRVRVVALDKTGTLTRSHPQLTQAIGLDCQDAGQVLALAAAVEATSEHPLAGAILDAASSRGLAWTPGQKLRAIPGV